ncbi:sensor histidine kinase [Gordonibacter sp. 28C]|uniref:sensor histidine kinase n=1 Tax=Gordonibacter sp. 28C TaxID=2078569 RepID=UPI000DF75E0E|nr:HAMP domain-containing sensor histidine kinase [Gordonibacter sp. 28C]RDB63989.1 sensor histidine kinase [Gordonibacter sp. 28C]
METLSNVRADFSGGAPRKGGMLLALVIARYFVYVLAAIVLLSMAVFAGFMVLVQSGVVYAANHAEEHLPEVTAELAAGDIQPQDLPSSYRWIVLDEAGAVVSSDMDEQGREKARAAALEGVSVVRYDGLGGAVVQDTVALPGGGTCALQYDYLPDFASRDARDALPNPQTLMGALLIVLLVAAIALIAVRASHVIARKMRPLADAAAHIERQDLDFAVGSTNVREMNEVLAAMERMRGALDESLHARWAADEARRRQVTALAHDLKTPLAVARWNADLLAETPLDEEQATCAAELSDSIGRMDGYVRLLVEASQTGAAGVRLGDVDIADLAAEVERQARQLCDAHGLTLDFSCALGGTLRVDRAQLARAAANLVDNAAEHAPAGSRVAVSFSEAGGAVRIAVEDEGPGFSAGALEHGKERFYTGSPDRNAASGHFGLGLSIVDDVAAAHDGTFELSNGETGGARCVIEVPRG